MKQTIHYTGPNADAQALSDVAMDMGAQLDTGQFLDWLSDRLVSVYKESENVDFVRSLKARSEALKKARHVDDE